MQIKPVLFAAIKKEDVKPGVSFRYDSTGAIFIPSQTLKKAFKVPLERRVGEQCIEPDDQQLYKVRGTRIQDNQTTTNCNGEFWFKKQLDAKGKTVWIDDHYSRVSLPPNHPT